MAIGDRVPAPKDGSTAGWCRAIAVNVFTACGAALALLALVAAVQAQWVVMFVLLGCALVVDGVDGTLARQADTTQNAPRWSGDVLDLVVDFTTYVFVPAYAIVARNLMPPIVALPLCMGMVVASAIYFSDQEMKVATHEFRGFPALWNVVAFYLFVVGPPVWLAATAIVVLMALMFAPIRFVHPLRTQRLRGLNIALMAVWVALAGWTLWRDLAPGAPVTAGLLAIGLYFLGAAILRWRR